MKVRICNSQREALTTIEVDPASPPGVVPAPGEGEGGTGREIYLDWDQAFDDEGRLRKCPVCGCPDLYRRRSVTPMTGLVMVIVIAFVVMLLWGIAQPPPLVVFGTLGVLVAANAAIYLFSPRRLICYRCRSTYHGVPPASGQGDWSADLAARYERGDDRRRRGSGP